jgi:polysaccharide pyruvyl transferase WcaK-like protein
MTKLIEIVGIGFPNKGAELMLYAIVDQLRERFGDDVRVCCRPWQGRWESYRLLGHKNILQVGHLTFKGISLEWAFNCLPLRLTDTLGIARPKDVDIVLDASGFRYSDSWGALLCESSYIRYEKMRKRGKKIVILPQAFGPFEDTEVAAAVRGVVACSDLCFARDDVSYKHLLGLCGETHGVVQAPDFTNLVEPLSGFDGKQFDGKIIVIPNYRMLDKTDKLVADNYYNYLLKVCAYLRDQGEGIVILNHEGAPDRKICEQLSEDCGGLSIISHWNPVYIKTVIGCCKLLISSRFHGCVSALSQGVPVIATSWNHKYEMLLKEYGLEGNVINLKSDVIDFEMIEKALLPATRDEIMIESRSLKLKTKEMWKQVFEFLSTNGV